MNPNVRRPDESQKAYRERRREENNAAKGRILSTLWDSASQGTAIRAPHGYRHKPAVHVQKYRPTEAEDNARGRAIRRRQNRFHRGWLPFAKR